MREGAVIPAVVVRARPGWVGGQAGPRPREARATGRHYDSAQFAYDAPIEAAEVR